MKIRMILLRSALMAATLAALAGRSATVTSVTARQDWPWTPIIYIDCTFTGDSPCDIDVTAEWRGAPQPLPLGAGNGLSGDSVGVSSGSASVAWDPRKAGITNALPELRFTVCARETASKTYMVFDLVSGEYEYLSEPPSGGWTQEHKTTKIVFRRIPAGTFKMGVSAELKTFVGFTSDREREHTVTLSSDYYMAIFPLTASQRQTISSGTANVSDVKPAQISYTDIRGNLASGANWPVLGHAVGASSWLALLRAKFDNAFLFDLPTEAMWERAARATSEGLWYAIDGYSAGGTVAELSSWGNAECESFLDSIANWRSSSLNTRVAAEVGLKTPNNWGLYDLLGLDWEWCLDLENLSALSDSTDPKGGTTSSDANRMRRGGFSTSTAFNQDVTIMRRVSYTVGRAYACRPCIFLKPLAD